MDKLRLYIKDSYNELVNRVTWPKLGELLVTSRVVVIATIIITALIFVMDFVSSEVLKIIYEM